MSINDPLVKVLILLHSQILNRNILQNKKAVYKTCKPPFLHMNKPNQTKLY